jgi:hypothetical protein
LVRYRKLYSVAAIPVFERRHEETRLGWSMANSVYPRNYDRGVVGLSSS